jgi:hypothetical protein
MSQPITSIPRLPLLLQPCFDGSSIMESFVSLVEPLILPFPLFPWTLAAHTRRPITRDGIFKSNWAPLASRRPAEACFDGFADGGIDFTTATSNNNSLQFTDQKQLPDSWGVYMKPGIASNAYLKPPQMHPIEVCD